MAASANPVDQYLPRLRSNDPTLTTLDLLNSRIFAEGAGRLATALVTNSTLTTLKLGGNGIGDEGAGRLSTALAANSTLTTLDLGYLNRITAEGAGRLATALATNSTLSRLRLSVNIIGDEGAGRLATALATNSTLTTLKLGRNNIGDEGARRLATALATNFTLTELKLTKNKISDTLLNQITELLNSAPARKRAAEEEESLNQARLRAEEEEARRLKATRLRAEEAQKVRLKAKEEEKSRRKAQRAMVESPFLNILNNFEISAASRDLLFDSHGLKLTNLKYLTFGDVSDSVKNNTPPLLPLDIRALFDELKSVSSPSTPPSPLPTPQPSFSQPQLIPHSELRYPIGKPLGTGAFGNVYVGEYKGAVVAVKELRSVNLESTADFLKEASVMTNLRSPLLVKLIGICLDPQIMVMELMAGGSLFDLLHQPPSSDLPWVKKIVLICEIARGIQFLHHHSTAHRDLKPANILLSQDHLHVKLGDFGFSRKVNTIGMLETVSMPGTPYYMAPELFSLTPSSTSNVRGLSCDIYAFSIIMWEIGYRKIPHRELGFDFTEFSSKIINEKLRPSIDLQEQLTHNFVTLMIRCWDHDPFRRPNINEVLDILLRCQDQPPGTNPYQPPVDIDWGGFSIGQNVAGPSSSNTNGDRPTPPLSSSSLALTAGQVSGEWTVAKWLTSLQLSDLIHIFESEGLIDPLDIKQLSATDLAEIGITKVVARNRILKFAPN